MPTDFSIMPMDALHELCFNARRRSGQCSQRRLMSNNYSVNKLTLWGQIFKEIHVISMILAAISLLTHKTKLRLVQDLTRGVAVESDHSAI